MASIRKTDSSTWQVRYRDPNGRQHARNFDRKTDASRFAHSVETDKARGDWLLRADLHGHRGVLFGSAH